ncbi:BrnT family toxin [Accumulibacter sp.]|jgi:uncharacterized DUF497 family protein|uniref:BrnT family toxin n=1 Tax=Accumulibacter sp. TaxID=2053492 RepID=UPI00258D01A6|nr:BrnT family toxin [Accumulibacter sp.]
MDFQWDEAKARSNEKKHGVSFVEAADVFADTHSTCVRDPDHSYHFRTSHDPPGASSL